MNNQEKIETAHKEKEGGNLLFKSGKYQRAAKKYDKVAWRSSSPSFLNKNLSRITLGILVLLQFFVHMIRLQTMLLKRDPLEMMSKS